MPVDKTVLRVRELMEVLVGIGVGIEADVWTVENAERLAPPGTRPRPSTERPGGKPSLSHIGRRVASRQPSAPRRTVRAVGLLARFANRP